MSREHVTSKDYMERNRSAVSVIWTTVDLPIAVRIVYMDMLAI